MSIYKTKEFSRFANKAALRDDDLLEAAKDVANGRWDANLGGGVFKQRIARRGSGKSGGFRTIILFKADQHSFLVHGFGKNDKANITSKELKALRALANTLFGLNAESLKKAISARELIEVRNDGEIRKKD